MRAAAWLLGKGVAPERRKVMNRSVYRYEFADDAPLEMVEEALLLSVVAVESLHGRSALRLSASFYLDKERRACVIERDTVVGQHLARVFTGLLTQELGEEAFRVSRGKDPEHQSSDTDEPEDDATGDKSRDVA